MSKKIYDLYQGKAYDRTKVGCDVFWSRGGVVTAVRRNRWQGNRDDIKVTLLERMSLTDAIQQGRDLSYSANDAIEELQYLGWCSRGTPGAGAHEHGWFTWRVTNTGYVVL